MKVFEIFRGITEVLSNIFMFKSTFYINCRSDISVVRYGICNFKNRDDKIIFKIIKNDLKKLPNKS